MDKALEANWQHLKDKRIYKILDGDETLEIDDEGNAIKMPYKSGPELVEILHVFGQPTAYDSRSRWQYMEELIDHCIRTDHVSEMLAHFFDIRSFCKELGTLTADEMDEEHRRIVTAALGAINGSLRFSDHKLKKVGSSYVVVSIEASIDMGTPLLKSIDNDYIRGLAQRMHDDIANKEYDSALTKARTLLEETFCHVIQLKGEKPSDSGDIQTLFKQVKTLYNMHADKSIDRRINDLITGLNKTVNSIAAMRNKQGDAHGVGASRVRIFDYHARLVVNSATNVAEFILAVAHNAERKTN